MPRSIWNGQLTFGLITVPIKVHSATEDRTVHFHQVHAADGARIKQKRICTKEDTEIPYKEVVKGYRVREDEYVVLTQDEIDAAAGKQSRQIELEEFVCADQIDPVFFDRTYHLGAGENGQDAYRLLHDALERAERVAIGRWVFHNREYLVAVRAQADAGWGSRKRDAAGVLLLHTMRFADELVPIAKLDLPEPDRAPGEREIEMAGKLVETLAARFDPTAFADTYRERVLELIERKARGEEVELPEREEPEQTPDLLAALEASLAQSGGKRAKAGGKRAKAGDQGAKRADGAGNGAKGGKRGKTSGRTKARS